MPKTQISMLVTSCDRPDLLKAALEFFYQIVDPEPRGLIICEDSDKPMAEFLTDFISKQRGLRWISGSERRGQASACARLIPEAKFEYTFWCEEDWLSRSTSTRSCVSRIGFLQSIRK